jgi:hypothetical protein
MRALSVVLTVLTAALAIACGGGNAASRLAEPPEYQPKDQTKCSVARSQSKPLIVEWPSAERGELEARTRRGVVVVRYRGCELQLLDGCSAPARYEYRTITRKRDRVEIHNEDDLYANLPVGAARLEGKLARNGELDVDMTMVGRWEADTSTIPRASLEGACSGATHVLSALTVGAFTFSAGANAEVGGGGTVLGAGASATSASSRETLTQDGDENACAKASTADTVPPESCGAVIRIEMLPLAPAATRASASPSQDGAARPFHSSGAPAGFEYDPNSR